MSRTALRGLAVLTATSVFNLAAANAEQTGYPLYPWCAQYGAGAGGVNCYFSTLGQCQQAASGNGGYAPPIGSMRLMGPGTPSAAPLRVARPARTDGPI